MSEQTLRKLSDMHPDELCQARGIEFEDEAVAGMAATLSAEQFLHWLIEQELYVEAIRYLAHALPAREAVWWACVSARRSLGGEPWPEDVAALEAAEAWVFKPQDDDLRRAAMQAAQATDLQSAAALAAVACFFSGGSIAPPEAEPEPPGEHLCSTMAASAVLYAVTRGADERAPDRYRMLLDMGLDIAAGGSGKKT